jgi:hypothetical protein
MVGVCLVAIFAVAAFASSSAMALPEWGKCEAKVGGKYSDGNCQTKAKKGLGTFEWHKGATLPNVPFTGHNVGSGGVLTTGLATCTGTDSGKRVTRKKCVEDGGKYEHPEEIIIKVECESETNNGEAVGKNKIANVSVVFHGCTIFGSAPCSNGAEGEIKVNPLKGELGYLNKGAKEVGVLLTPVQKKGLFAKFECAGYLETSVGVGNSKEGAWYEPESKGGNDGIISPVTPVNTMTNEFTQVFTANEASENVPSKFEGKPIHLLEDYVVQTENGFSTVWQQASEEITNVNTPSEEGEIKA